MRIEDKQKLAFTMLELVMVIIVIGILAALAIPRMERDIRQEAADNILSAIRYTQHLALVDDKTDPFDANWQRKLWAIRFTISASNPANSYYTVISNMNLNNGLTKAEAAIDPANGKPMFGDAGLCASDGSTAVSSRIFITKKYGITAVDFTGDCNGTANGSGGDHIGFDHLGRPHHAFSALTTPTYDGYMSQRCVMEFTLSNGKSFKINIEPETGYAFIDGQTGS